MTRERNEVRGIPSRAAAVVASDTEILEADSVLYIGGDGDCVVYTSENDGPLTFKGLVAGDILPVSVRRVMEASTCTDMIAVW